MKKLFIAMTMALGLSAFASEAEASCRVDLVGPRGGSLQTFQAPRCQGALRRCRVTLNARRDRGRLHRGSCQIVADYGRPGWDRPGYGRQVVRTCTVNLEQRGRHWRRPARYPHPRRFRTVVDTFTARARGQFRTGVKQRACNKAMRRCERNRGFRQVCVQAF